MSQTLYAISPINHIKVPVGKIELRYSVAVFDITEDRFFAEANACGPDLRNYNQKSVQWCKYIQFNLWDGRRFKITMEDFRANCWQYPNKNDLKYKANGNVFVKKLMITLENLAKLHEKNREAEKLEILKTL